MDTKRAWFEFVGQMEPDKEVFGWVIFIDSVSLTLDLRSELILASPALSEDMLREGLRLLFPPGHAERVARAIVGKTKELLLREGALYGNPRCDTAERRADFFLEIQALPCPFTGARYRHIELMGKVLKHFVQSTSVQEILGKDA
jgi:hypothetical protein